MSRDAEFKYTGPCDPPDDPKAIEQANRWLKIIEEKAWEHVGKYPTFDYSNFIDWVEAHEDTWLKWASGKSTASLNKVWRREKTLSRLADRMD